MAFWLLLVQAVTMTIGGWLKKLANAGALEWMWIGLRPLLAFVFFRFFSIFNPCCRVCAPPHAETHVGENLKA